MIKFLIQRVAIIFLIFIVSNQTISSQIIANSIEVLSNDSLKFYFKPGRLCEKNCAEYYRVAKMDIKNYIFNGDFTDYYINGQIACKGSYLNNELNGSYILYYKAKKKNKDTPQIREFGEYNSGEKIGEWKYFYENGQLKKTLIFYPDSKILNNLYKKNGKTIIQNGNGYFKSNELIKDVIISGNIENGKQEGEWTAYSNFTGKIFAVEKFENGRFVEGYNIPFKDFSDNNEVNKEIVDQLGIDKINTGEKYYINQYCIIDNKIDLLNKKLSKNIYGMTNCNNMIFGYIHERQFFDYIYENLDIPFNETGYIIIGFKHNSIFIDSDIAYIKNDTKKIENADSSNIFSDISIFSTLNNKSVELKLKELVSQWKPYKFIPVYEPFNDMFILFFSNNRYEIIGDIRNDYYSVETEAEYISGNQAFIEFVKTNITIPKDFNKSYNIEAVTFCFTINEDKTVDLEFNNNFYKYPEFYKLERRLLFEEAKKVILMTSGAWQPATIDNIPVKYHYTGILNIIDGNVFFRIFDNHVKYTDSGENGYRIEILNHE